MKPYNSAADVQVSLPYPWSGRLVRQPEGSNQCGQACVAMLANIQLEEAVAACKTTGKTTTLCLRRALTALGLRCGSSLIYMTKRTRKPNICIVRLHFKDETFTHWTLYYYGKYYDPAIGVVDSYPDTVRETSYLAIF